MAISKATDGTSERKKTMVFTIRPEQFNPWGVRRIANDK